LSDFEPKPAVCDNNFLACSKRHIQNVIQRFQSLRHIDFNQGLGASLLTSWHIEQLKTLDLQVIRLAWDYPSQELSVLSAIEELTFAGFPASKIRCYVLVGYKETPEEALYRCETLKALGVMPNVQRYQPLDTLKKNAFCPPQWDPKELLRFCRYWNRQNWLKKVPYKEFIYG